MLFNPLLKKTPVAESGLRFYLDDFWLIFLCKKRSRDNLKSNELNLEIKDPFRWHFLRMFNIPYLRWFL
jgi:hypothetical protein